MRAKAKRVVILGATGSIGRSAVEVVRGCGAFRAVALAARSSGAACRAAARSLRAKAYVGEGAALRAVAESDADVCLVATVGASGLELAMAAIGRGMDVALATKEALVMAGGAVMDAARRAGVSVLPVDSEHSAISQCLLSGEAKDVERLTLTASGGPFLRAPKDLSRVTPAAALRHPKWKMGRKVSVDSATMMNKGFEIAEARWLFGVPEDRIDVVVHPQSVVHGLVTFADGATLAQMSPPDMRLAIRYALAGGARTPSALPRLDLVKAGPLTFERPDERRFPCLALARAAFRAGGTAPAVLAAADEWAVEAFLAGRIRFDGIPALVERCLEALPSGAGPCREAGAAIEAASRAAAMLDGGAGGEVAKWTL